MFTSELPKPDSTGLYVLSAATFMALTTELAPIGLILDIAHTFQMKVGDVGLAMGAYALIVAVCAVPITRLSHFIDRKKMMVAATIAYLICNLICSVAPSFWILCVGRMIGGIAHCITMSLAPAYAARLVPARFKGRAISLVYTGASIGSVVGMPATAALGNVIGWRNALLISALINVIGMLLLIFYLPRISTSEEDKKRKSQPARKGALTAFYWAILTNMVLTTANCLLYTFMSPILVQHGLDQAWLGAVLLVISSASLIGIWFSGRMVDKNSRLGIFIGTILMIVGMAPVCIAHSSSTLVIIGAFVWCVGNCSLVPFVMSGAMATNAKSPDITSAAINSCCNVGIFLGATVGGQIITVMSISRLAIIAIAMVLVGILMVKYGKEAFPKKPEHAEA